MSIEKSIKAARGSFQYENTNINLLKANDYVPGIIRNEMAETNTLLINITSSGRGKTTLMQKTAKKLKDKLTMAVMVGDLGEDYRVTLMATTEGDDKPKKYLRMFLTSDMMLVSKSDLLPYLPFSVEAVIKDALEVNHELEVLQISALKDERIDAWCDWLLNKRKTSVTCAY
ncbi:MAG: hypothetical protein L3J06_07350 [Cyclobacteriaceae bacterium]|nr:hypothetical protein [Cyclobacteriaceae bacterium]